ncbi:hypothetical protein [Streptomyces sp. NPDC005438]
MVENEQKTPLPDDWTAFWEHLAELFEEWTPERLNGPQKAA